MRRAVIVSMLLLLVFVVGCTSKSDSNQLVSRPAPQVQETPVQAPDVTPVTPPLPVDAAPTPQIPAEAAVSASIDIQNFAFSPVTVTIRKGGSVAWTQKDSVRHNVVSDDGKFEESPLLNLEETWTFKFDNSGTYKYHCGPHPRMTGTVVVV